MGGDRVWNRIRWDNVGRLAALVALSLLVAAWPRLGGPPPRLPAATAVPLRSAKTRAPAVVRARSPRKRERRARRTPADRRRRSAHRARERARPSPARPRR